MIVTNKRRVLQVVRAASFVAVATISAGCDAGPVAPITAFPLSTTTTRAAAGSTLVPIKGTFESRALPPTAQSCPAGSFRTNGAGDGIVTHLGRMTQTITGCLNPVTLTSSGTAAFTAANGDGLYLSVTSTAAPGGSPGIMVVTTTGTMTGGTGRFADATGFVTIVTVFDAATGVGTATLDGKISMGP